MPPQRRGIARHATPDPIPPPPPMSWSSTAIIWMHKGEDPRNRRTIYIVWRVKYSGVPPCTHGSGLCLYIACDFDDFDTTSAQYRPVLPIARHCIRNRPICIMKKSSIDNPAVPDLEKSPHPPANTKVEVEHNDLAFRPLYPVGSIVATPIPEPANAPQNSLRIREEGWRGVKVVMGCVVFASMSAKRT